MSDEARQNDPLAGHVKPSPPWSCEGCGLVNWPNWEDGSARKACRRCGRVRAETVTVEQFLDADAWEV